MSPPSPRPSLHPPEEAARGRHVDWLVGDNNLAADAQVRGHAPRQVTLVRARIEAPVRTAATAFRTFPDLTVQVLARGRVSFQADLGCGVFTADATPGAALITPPDQPCRLHPEASAFETLMLAAPWNQVAELVGPAFDGEPPDFSPLYARLTLSRRVDLVMQRLWSDLEAGGPGGRLLAEGGVVELLGALLQAAGRNISDPRKGGLTPAQLSRSCEVMAAHLEDGVGLAELARATGLSPSHFSRAFKRATGQSPSAWLLQRRIEHAEALLVQGELPLAQVALAVGFSAQAAFTTAFRRARGLSPGAWRRAHAV